MSSPTAYKKLYIVVGVFFISILLGGFGWYNFAISSPDKLSNSTVTLPKISACQEANEAMEAIKTQPNLNSYNYKPYVLIYTKKSRKQNNYPGPDYIYLIQSLSSTRLIASRINMESEISMADKRLTFAKCNLQILEKEIGMKKAKAIFGNEYGLSIDQCLVFLSDDIKGKYPVYLKIENCVVIKYKGNFKENELKKEDSHG
ncbi:MAG: hypothetical protein HRT90_12190 [Candidatus Margulisbacteria bacterium]|nr:hypothetical protein [Candidatus Margulisiibacteriota bacterium]